MSPEFLLFLFLIAEDWGGEGDWVLLCTKLAWLHIGQLTDSWLLRIERAENVTVMNKEFENYLYCLFSSQCLKLSVNVYSISVILRRSRFLVW